MLFFFLLVLCFFFVLLLSPYIVPLLTFKLLQAALYPACAWKALLACRLNASHVLYLQSYYPSCLHLVDEFIVDEAFPITSILSMKTSSGRSATTVETKLGLYYKCFHR